MTRREQARANRQQGAVRAGSISLEAGLLGSEFPQMSLIPLSYYAETYNFSAWRRLGKPPVTVVFRPDNERKDARREVSLADRLLPTFILASPLAHPLTQHGPLQGKSSNIIRVLPTPYVLTARPSLSEPLVPRRIPLPVLPGRPCLGRPLLASDSRAPVQHLFLIHCSRQEAWQSGSAIVFEAEKSAPSVNLDARGGRDRGLVRLGSARRG